ncbi:MAG: hypothetical protein HWN67_00470 [Candidatus Helarchaeota archaeon]|nr:hypothetical protein [Candidatus Helarchaeota archaeon]
MGKSKKEKSLEEIYKESREREGPVVIPPQVDAKFLEDLKKITNIENFVEIIKEFKKYQKLALDKPGKIVPGNMILGAPAPKYFEPSEEERRLAEIGRAIGMILPSINKKNVKKIAEQMVENDIFVDQIIYQDIQFYHVDVVGSGRFIYPQITWDIAHSILDYIDKAVNKKIVSKQITKIKTALNEPKITTKKDIFSLKVKDKSEEIPKYKVTNTIQEKGKKSTQKIKELFVDLSKFIKKFYLK